MSRALIYGGGALGRGFVAPLLGRLGCSIEFVDSNEVLVDQLRSQRCYRVAQTTPSGYAYQTVYLDGAYLPSTEGEALARADHVFLCVGPANAERLAPALCNAKQIFVLENDRNCPLVVAKRSGVKCVYFGIADVIVSSTAPSQLLAEDTLTVVAERGDLILERGDYRLPCEIRQVEYDDLERYWACKFFLHNTPHAVAAFLAQTEELEYIHEAMALPKIAGKVENVLNTMKAMLIQTNRVSKEVAEKYAARELARFRNSMLHDPINRVARDPMRKLARDDRLILSAKLSLAASLSVSVSVSGLLDAIIAAFDSPDPELTWLKSHLSGAALLERVCGLDTNDRLGNLLLKRING